MRPEDLDLLRVPSAPAVHPDGGRAVVAVVRPDLASDEYVGQLWEVPLDPAADGPRRLTAGHRDTEPRWSPDGRQLAFLRTEPNGGKPQLHVLSAAGGEPVRLTDAPLGVSGGVWSPDSRRIALIARVPEPGRYGTQDGVVPAAEPPRMITTLRYRLDDTGFLGDQRAHVHVLDVPDVEAETGDRPELRQVTSGDHDHTSVDWSPDGALLVFASARHQGRDRDLRVDSYVCAPDGSGLRAVTGAGDGNTWGVRTVRFASNGDALWLLAQDLGPDGIDFVARTTGLYHVPLDGSAQPRRLTDPDVDLEGSDPTVLHDRILVRALHRGAVELWSVSADGTATTLLDGPIEVQGQSATAHPNASVVVTVADQASVGEVVLVDSDGGTHQLTAFSSALAPYARHEVRTAADDGYPVHGWVVRPRGAGPHPVVLMIHGGPYAHYGWGFFDEAQVLAGAGYAVVLGNPRGSAGYGEKHGGAIRYAFGDRDTADVLALLEAALCDPAHELDGRRVGVMGGSYGGFLTAWLTTRTDRFAAAIVERGFLDPVSFLGSADIGWFFADQYLGTDPDRVLAQSPMAAVERVSTPTLVIHSEHDWRCPVEQGQRWYVALSRRGIDSALLLFPGEGHELTRSGRPRHRRARFDAVLAWWARHLPLTAPPGP